MAGASDRMAQDGVLYDGWGAEGLKSLNASNSLLDHADDVGVNRYDLTRIVAQQAKDIAYAHCTEDDMLNPMLAGNQARTPRSRVPHVMRAIKELQIEIDESYAPATEVTTSKAKPKAKPSPKEARTGAAQASRGANPAPAPSISLDGDGGQANLQKLNQELLDAEDAEQAAERLGTAAGAAAAAEPLSDDGFDQLLADLSEVDMDDDDFDDAELDDAAIDDLFGSVVVDNTGGSLESSGMHPGD